MRDLTRAAATHARDVDRAKASEARRDDEIRAAHEAGASTREIAGAVTAVGKPLSHQRVSQICSR